MARLTDTDRENILADFHTGGYSNNELAKKYNTTHTTINKLVKGLEPKNKEIVSRQIANNTELATQSFKEVSAVETLVKEKTRHLEFITNLTLKNLKVMSKKIDEDATIFDHKAIQDTILVGAKTLGVHEDKPQVAIQNNQINNNLEDEIIITVKE